jgi:serine/threonine-protein kinase
VGRYEVQRSVGEGGMATVYLARDEKHGRLVAIKVLRPELGASIGSDRFLREIRTAAQLQHPNILALYDSGEADGLLFEGESLRDRLNREKQLPIEDAVMLVREAADALHFAHQHGVVHRDIKPENILIQGGHALVADFGIARAFSEAGGEKLTQTGMAIGTPHYMSPEQGMGGDVDGRSDVYSLGCVLYELLVGQPPFDGPNAMAILARHSMEAVPAMHVVRRTVPEDLESVVEESLEKSAADRFQTAEDFSEALLSVDLSHVTRRHAVPRVTMSRVAARKKQRRKTFLIAGAAGAVVLAGAAVAVTALRGGGNTSRPQEDGWPASSIAVLYFDARGGDSVKYVADGLTEALITQLSGVNGLKVISRNGVRPFRGQDLPPDSIGARLQVGTIVSGTVSQAGDLLRLDISLVKAKGGAELGNKRLERPRTEVFALQDSLAADVASVLRRELGQAVKLQNTRLGTRNAKAWELAQKAEVSAKDAETMVAEGKLPEARRHLALADSLLVLASQEDRRWVAPLAQRAKLVYRDCRMSGNEKVYNDTCTARGIALAEAAVALDSTDPDAREARGELKYLRYLLSIEANPDRAEKLMDEAEADFRAAIEANPTQAYSWNQLSHLLTNRAQAGESKLAALKAYEHDPYLANAHVTVGRLFYNALDAGDLHEANNWCQEGARRFPNEPRFALCQVQVFAMPGATPDVEAAWKNVARFVELSEPSRREYWQKRASMMMALALVRAGLPDSAKRVAERARADLSVDPTLELVYIESLMLALIPDKDAAFSRLSAFLAAHPQQGKNLEKDDTWWTKELRSDPRWRSLVLSTR